MGKLDDQVAIMGDWMPPSPHPRALFLSMMGDDVDLKANTEANDENKSGALVMAEEQIVSKYVDEKEEGIQAEAGVAVNQVIKTPERRVTSCGGLLERVAAIAGFNALRLNTEGIRSTDISQNTEVRSPYLTIPPGLSPTTLLDSPLFLSDSLVQSSPTTGKFQFSPSGNNRNSSFSTEAPDKRKDKYFEDINNSSFAFKPVVESSHRIFPMGGSQAIPFTLAQSSFPGIEFSVQSENSLLPQNMLTKLASQSETALNFQADLYRCSYEKHSGGNSISLEPKIFTTDGGSEHCPLLDDQKEEDVDQRGGGDTNFGGAPSEDGYNWRKYGQKQVKGSEYPRSYYKCTHPNCPVKKKVERSHEGHITEIIYKGTHSHPKPPNRRSALVSSHVLSDMQFDVSEQDGLGAEGNPFWTTMQKLTAAGVPDWRQGNLEVTSSMALDTEYCNASASLLAQNGAQFEAGDAVDGSSAFSNDEDEDDRGTHGSVSLGYDGEEDESESKRRKIDAYSTEMSGATRAIREPRVVVQTTSEVDILDDGYRWRKYGQKVVKGNPNPRSYYKCTSAGCTVRKHVERASHDLKSVITTYEGKHNHDVPAPRNSNHINSTVSNTLPTQAPGVQSHLRRLEPFQVHNSMARFDRPSALGSFGMLGRPQLGLSHGFGFGMSQPGVLNLAMAGLPPNQGKLPMPPHHPYSGQANPINEMGFMLPKDPKVESISEPAMIVPNGQWWLQENELHQHMQRILKEKDLSMMC